VTGGQSGRPISRGVAPPPGVASLRRTSPPSAPPDTNIPASAQPDTNGPRQRSVRRTAQRELAGGDVPPADDSRVRPRSTPLDAVGQNPRPRRPVREPAFTTPRGRPPPRGDEPIWFVPPLVIQPKSIGRRGPHAAPREPGPLCPPAAHPTAKPRPWGRPPRRGDEPIWFVPPLVIQLKSIRRRGPKPAPRDGDPRPGQIFKFVPRGHPTPRGDEPIWFVLPLVIQPKSIRRRGPQPAPRDADPRPAQIFKFVPRGHPPPVA
jgi:hypothetical protein